MTSNSISRKLYFTGFYTENGIDRAEADKTGQGKIPAATNATVPHKPVIVSVK